MSQAEEPPEPAGSDIEARILMGADVMYRTLVEIVPAIVYIDAYEEGFRPLFVSPHVRDLLGVEPRQWISEPGLWESLLHPDDRERVLAEAVELAGRGGRFTQEYRMIGRNGRLVWFQDDAVIVPDESGTLTYVHGVMLDITERKKAEAQIAFMAYHDRLTGLPNRAMFEEVLQLSLTRARRHDLGVAVLYLDLDNFKLVNDSFGHQSGDELLEDLAERLTRSVRETDLVARQGGDEFLILLGDLERGPSIAGSDADSAILVAESVASRIREALQEPFTLKGTEFFATGSIGISMYPEDAKDAVGLLKNADVAMYQSKRTERGGWVMFAAAEGADPLDKLSFTTRLRRAVDQQNWILHYQPVVRLSDGFMTGVEALVRWQDPNGGIIPPGEFIPLAEEMGLIEAIGDWVISELARQDREWRKQGLGLEVSFNLSPRQLWQPDLADLILARLDEHGVNPGGIVVEITESTAMTDPDRTQRILWELHARGLRLAIDDFGTGYSSLSRLKHLPVDVLKIDRSFVREVDIDPDTASMVQAMVQLARNLDMVPLAEGIETAGEQGFLLEHGCPLGQGFHFSRPITAEEILRLWQTEGGRIVPALAGD